MSDMTITTLLPSKTLPGPAVEHDLTLLDNPTKLVDIASKAARQLQAIVQQKEKPVIINGQQYLEFEDWMTIGAFYGITADVEWTKDRLDKDGKILGVDARAVARRQGAAISHAEATVLFAEKNWMGRDYYAVKSMAQTRAAAKALRNVLAWQVVLAGFKPTPAEEMIEPEGEAVSGEDNMRKSIAEWLLEIHGGNQAQAQQQLQDLTAFKGRTGDLVEGVNTTKLLRGKRLQITFHKVKKLYDTFATATDPQKDDD